MFYKIQITAETTEDCTSVLHPTVSMSTLTSSKEQVTDEEIEIISSAFKAQVKMLLEAVVFRR